MARKQHRMIGKVESIAYHRNGISGAPFSVVTFTHRVEGEPKPRNMVAVVFDAPYHTAVFDRDALGAGAIAFGGTDDGQNSWRGDNFDAELRAAIAEHEAAEEHDAKLYPTWGPNGKRLMVSIPESEN